MDDDYKRDPEKLLNLLYQLCNDDPEDDFLPSAIEWVEKLTAMKTFLEIWKLDIDMIHSVNHKLVLESDIHEHSRAYEMVDKVWNVYLAELEKTLHLKNKLNFAPE